MLTLAAIPVWLIGLLVALFVVLSVMMMLVVLIQRPQGGGLSEAFGAGGGSGATAFGAKTGDALTTATIGIFVLFICFAVGLNYVVKPPAPADAQPVLAAPEAPAGGAAPAGGTQGVTATATDEKGNAAPITLTPLSPSEVPQVLKDLPPVQLPTPAPGAATPGTTPAPSGQPTTPPAQGQPPAANPPASTPPASTPPPAEQPKPQ